MRNHLQELVDAGRWDKTPPGPELPDEIVTNTLLRYEEARRLAADLSSRRLQLRPEIREAVTRLASCVENLQAAGSGA